MAELLRWIELDKQSLPGLIAEGAWPAGHAREVPAPALHGSALYVGVLGGGTDQESFKSFGAARPVVVVVNAESARDIFAWLATYSPASFPITQSMRVLTTEDFHAALSPVPSRYDRSIDLGYWPCIVFGELLGQVEQAVNIDSVVLSRASACFSFAQARAEDIHGAASSTASRCEQRLGALQGDRIFLKRSISVEELKPVWACTRADLHENSLQRELARLVDDASNGGLREGIAPLSPLLSSAGLDALALSTGPIESRVRSFQAFVQLLESVRSNEMARSQAMLLAAAAICVGNGTSHVSLLEDFGKKFPAAFAWFGLFAAIAGPKGWDPSWNRAINSMGRMLRSRFELSDAPAADLSWVEYEFVREVARPSEFLKRVPKFYPKSLSVEVAPGATCQLRLSDDYSASVRAVAAPAPPRIDEIREARSPQVVRSDPLATVPGLAASLEDLQRALSRSQDLVRSAIAASGRDQSNQTSLFGDSASKPKKRGSKKSRPV